MTRKRKKKKPEVRHLDRFMGGRRSPQDLHRELGIAKQCHGCDRPAAIRLKVLAELSELTRRYPEFVGVIAANHPDGIIPTVETKHGPMVWISDVGACDLCRATAEKTAARDVPSWCLVEIDRGPPADRGFSQVPG